MYIPFMLDIPGMMWTGPKAKVPVHRSPVVYFLLFLILLNDSEAQSYRIVLSIGNISETRRKMPAMECLIFAYHT
jgi:hypothetical protein